MHLPPGATVATPFPFGNCLRRPEFGYTTQHFTIEDLPDLTRNSVAPLRGRKVDALAVFPSSGDPLGLMHMPLWVGFLERFYRFEPDVTADQIPALLGMHRVARFEHGGQWIELFEP